MSTLNLKKFLDPELRDQLTQLNLDKNNNPIIPPEQQHFNMQVFSPAPKLGYSPSAADIFKEREAMKNLARYNSRHIYNTFKDTETGEYLPISELANEEVLIGNDRQYQLYNRKVNREGSRAVGMGDMEENQYLYPVYDPDIQRPDGGTGDWIMAASKTEKNGGLEELSQMGADIYNVTGESPYERSFIGNLRTGYMNGSVGFVTAPVNMAAWAVGLGKSYFNMMKTSANNLVTGNFFPKNSGFESEEGDLDEFAKNFSKWMNTFGKTTSSLQTLQDPYSADAFSEGVGQAINSLFQYSLMGTPVSKLARSAGAGIKSSNLIGMVPAGMVMNGGEAYEIAAQAGLSKDDKNLFVGLTGLMNTLIELGGANVMPSYLFSAGGAKNIAKVFGKELGKDLANLSKASPDVIEGAVKRTVSSTLKDLNRYYNRITSVPVLGAGIEEFTEEALQSATLSFSQILYDNYFAEDSATAGKGKFGKYYDEQVWKDMLWEGAIGAVTGAMGGGAHALTYRNTGTETLANYIASGKEKELLTEANTMLQANIITQEQYADIKQRVDVLTEIRNSNKDLFINYLNEEFYNKKVASALQTLSGNKDFLKAKAQEIEKAKAGDTTIQPDLAPGLDLRQVSFNSLAIDNVLIRNTKKFRAELESLGLKNYAAILDNAEQAYTNMNSMLKDPRYSFMGKALLNATMENDAQILFGTHLSNKKDAGINKILSRGTKGVTKESLEAQEIKTRIATIDKLLKKDSKAEKKDIELKTFNEFLNKEGEKSLNKTKESLQKRYEELKANNQLGDESESKRLLDSELVTEDIENSQLNDFKIETSNEVIQFYNDTKNIKKTLNELIEANRQEQEIINNTQKSEESKAKKDARKDREKAYKAAAKVAVDDMPPPMGKEEKDIFSAMAEEDRKAHEMRKILADPEATPEKKMEATEFLNSLELIHKDASDLMGPIAVSPNSYSSADEKTRQLEEVLLGKHDKKRGNKTIITNLAYLHDEYEVVETPYGKHRKTKIDQGKIVSNPNADWRLSLPEYMTPGTEVVLYIDTKNPLYNQFKDDSTRVPIAVQTKEDYEAGKSPTAYIHTLDWVAVLDAKGKPSKRDGNYISDNVAEGSIGQVFKETKDIRDKLFKSEFSETKVFNSTITSKGTGMNRHSREDVNVVTLMEKDSRLFFGVGSKKAGLEVSVLNADRVNDDLRAYAVRGVPYMFFPNAAGSYSMTRLKQTPLEKTPELHQRYTDNISAILYDFIKGGVTKNATISEVRDFLNFYVYTSEKTKSFLKTSTPEALLSDLEDSLRSQDVRKDLIFNIFQGRDGEIYLVVPSVTKSFDILRTEIVIDAEGNKTREFFTTKIENKKLILGETLSRMEVEEIISNAIAKKFPNIVINRKFDATESEQSQIDPFLDARQEFIYLGLNDQGNLEYFEESYLEFLKKNKVLSTNLSPIQVNGTWVYTAQPSIGINSNLGQEEKLDYSDITGGFTRVVKPSAKVEAVVLGKTEVPTFSTIKGDISNYTMSQLAAELKNLLGKEQTPEVTSDKEKLMSYIASKKKGEKKANEDNNPKASDLISYTKEGLADLNIASFTLFESSIIEEQVVRNLTRDFIRLEERFKRDKSERKSYYTDRILRHIKEMLLVDYKIYLSRAENALMEDDLESFENYNNTAYNFKKVYDNFEPQLDPARGTVFVGFKNKILQEVELLDFKVNNVEGDEIEENGYLARTQFDDDYNLKRDPEKSAAGRVKRFIYMLDLPTGDSDILGKPLSVEHERIYGSLLEAFADIPQEDMAQALEDMALGEIPLGERELQELGEFETDETTGKRVAHPILYKVLESLRTKDAGFKNEFFSVMHKTAAGAHLKVLLYRPPKKQHENGAFNVLDSNSRGAVNVVLGEWKQKFYENAKKIGLVKIDKETGSLYIDRQIALQIENQFNNLFKGVKGSELPKFRSEVVRFLNALGIGITEKMMQNMFNDRKYSQKNSTFKRYFGTARESSFTEFFRFHFGDIVSTLTSAPHDETLPDYAKYNPFFTKAKELGILAKYYLRDHPEVFSSSFKNGHNDTIYGYVEASYLTDRFFRFKSENDQFLKKKLDNPFSKRSTWLTMMLAENTDSSLKLKRAFELSLLDSSKNSKNYEGAIDFEEQSEREREITRLNLFANNNKKEAFFIYSIPGDKTRFPIIQAPRFRGNFRNYGATYFNGDIDYSKDPILLDTLMNLIVYSELDRINQVVKEFNGIDPKDRKQKLKEGYHYFGESLGMGAKFNLIPELNNIIDINISGETILLEEDIAKVKEFLGQYLKNMVQERVAMWQKNGIVNIESQRTLIDYKYLKDLTSQIPAQSETRFKDTINLIATDYVVNNIIATTNMSMLFMGDPALFGKKNKFDATVANIFKRTAKDIAPGSEGNWGENNKYVNYVFTSPKRISTEASLYSNELREFIGKNYSNIDHTDGIEYITAEEYIQNLFAYGKISEKIRDQILKDLKEREYLDPELLSYMLNPLKQVYVDSDIYGIILNNGERSEFEDYYYFKSSSIPLIPQLTKQFPSLDRLRKELERNKARLVITENSSAKLGPKNLIEVFDENGNFKEDLNITTDKVISLSRRGLRTQQDVPYEATKHSIISGSQKAILQFADIPNSVKINFGKYGELSSEDLFNLDGAINSHFYKKKFTKLLGELGLVEYTRDDNVFYRPSDLNKIKNILVEEATKREGYSVNDLLFLNILDEVLGNPQAFSIPLFFHPSINKIESLLNSILSNRVLERKLPGKSYVQESSAGFIGGRTLSESFAKKFYKDQIIFSKDYNPSRGLSYIEAEDGSIEAEVFMPFYFKNSDGNPLSIEEYVVDGYIDTSKLDPKLLKLFGYRIPTQGFSSMVKLKIVGFLPEVAGDLVIVPPQMLRQMGSDFDIDKLYTHHYHYILGEDGNISKLEPTEFKNTEKLFENISELPDKELENIIIDITMSILSSKDIREMQLEPLDNPVMNEVADELDRLVGTSSKRLPTIIDLNVQNDAVTAGASGKLGISIASASSVSHAYGQYANLYIQRKFTNDGVITFDGTVQFLDENGKLYIDSDRTEDFQTNRTTKFDPELKYSHRATGAWRLDKIYGFTKDKDGSPRRISSVIRNLQTASVDNASDPKLHRFNLNSETFDIALLIARSGFDERFIGAFLRQDIIVKYVDALRNSKGFLKGDFGDTTVRDFIDKVYDDAGIESPKDMGIKAFSLNQLRDFLTEGENLDAMTKAQLLNNFLKWKKISSDLSDVQNTFNSQSKKLGKSIYSTVYKADQGKKMIKGYGLIGNVDRLAKLESTAGGAFYYGVDRGSYVYNSSILLPIRSRLLTGQGGVISEIARIMGETRELREDVVNDIVTNLRGAIYTTAIRRIFTDEDILGKDLRELRESLLYGENSLANRLRRFSTNNPFLNALVAEIAEEAEIPNLVRFLSTRGLSEGNVLKMQSAWLKLLRADKNSEDYKIGRDLLIYAFMIGNERNANDFGRFIPVDIFEELGLGEYLYDIDFHYATNGGVSSLIMERFVKQWFQHNPFRTLRVAEQDIFKQLDIDDKGIAHTIVLKGTLDTGSKTSDLQVRDENGLESIAPFISRIIKDPKGNKRILLYERNYDKTKREVYEFKLIPTLGYKKGLIKEYDLDEINQTSIIAENFEELSKRMKEEKPMREHKKAIDRAEINLASKRGGKSNTLNIKRDKGRSYAKSIGYEEGLLNTLKTIEQTGTTPSHKAWAKFLLDKKNRVDLTRWNLEYYNEDNEKHWKDNYNRQQELEASRSLKGRTKYENGLMLLNPDNLVSQYDAERTFLHEVLHVYLKDLILSGNLNAEETLALNSIKSIIRSLKSNPNHMAALKALNDNEILYGLGALEGYEISDNSPSAVLEFISVLVTNDNFQNYLNEVTYSKLTGEKPIKLIDRIWNLIQKLLGITPSKNSTLSQSFRSIITLLERDEVFKSKEVISEKSIIPEAKLSKKASEELVPLPEEFPEPKKKNGFDALFDLDSSDLVVKEISNNDRIIKSKEDILKILYNRISQKGSNRIELGTRIDRLKAQIKALKSANSVLEAETALVEDINTIRRILKRVNEDMTSNLTFEDVHSLFRSLEIVDYYLDTWKDLYDLIPYQFSEAGQTRIMKFNKDLTDLTKSAKSIKKTLMATTFNNFSFRKDFTEEGLFEGIKDISSITSATLGLAHSNADLGKIAHDLLTNMQTEYNFNFYQKRNEIDRRIKDLERATGLSGMKLWDNLLQKRDDGSYTGNYISQYKQEYFDRKSELARDAQNTGDWNSYYDFIKKNTIPVTESMIKGEEQGNWNNEEFEAQKRLYAEYLEAEEAYKNDLLTDPNIVDSSGNFLNKQAARRYESAIEKWRKINSPIRYLRMKSGKERYSDVYKGNKYMIKEIPSEKWRDPRFNNMSPEIRKFYDFMVETFRENSGYLPYRQKKAKSRYLPANYLPELSKSFVETVNDANLLSAMSGLVEDIKESFWEQDDNLVENSIIMGKSEVRFIPVAMMNNSLTPDKKSLDIGKILLAHTAMSMGYKYKSSIEPLISSITQMLATMNEGDVVEVGSNFIPRTDKHGKILETNRPLEQTRKHLEGTISAILYNDYHNKSKVFKKYTAEEKKKLKELQNDLKTAKEFKDEELIKSEISKLGKTLDLNTIVTGLNRWTYTVGLGFPNLISPVVNLAYGLVSNLTYSASSKYVTDANMIKGMGMMMGAISRRAVTKADAKNLIKIYGFMDALGLLTHIVDSAYNEETKITKLLVMFQTKAEYINQGSLMIGILKTLTMKDKNGNTVPIWDAFTINENNALVWNTDKMGEPNIEFMGDILVSKDGKKLNISRLGAVIKSEVSKVHGDYESIMVGKRDPFFKLVALFKTWLPEAAHHRFGKTWFNPSTQTWEKGRYRSIFSSETESGEVITPGKAMKEIALSMLKLSQKNSFSGYSEADRTNMARNIREFQFIALLTSVALLLSSATKDDEDEEYRRFLFMLINILNKTSIDLAFFADPRATLKIFDNAIPSFTLIARTADIFDIALDTITGDGEIKSGPFKGMNKTLKWAADITPGAAGAIKIYNAGERLFEYR